MRTIRRKEMERMQLPIKKRVKRRRERNNKTVQHINNGLVSTLSRAERKIQDAFNNIPSGK